MNTEDRQAGIETELIAGWLRARSVARDLPLPVADHGGWRVDTGQPDELRRYVFARAGEGLRLLSNAIEAPGILLKLCGSAEDMRTLLPPRWQFQEQRYVMTGEAYHPADTALPPGYTVQLSSSGVITAAGIVTGAGELAASGYAAEVDGFFIYDRIATEPSHRRRGLGASLMQALHSARESGSSIQILVATADGRALYSALGWRTRSLYTTAHIPG
jgi:GNAT superfamily N-acetyltransferase